MCNAACIEFARSHLDHKQIANKRVLEVGSFDVNGSLRKMVEEHRPQSYLGVDISSGPGVDEICAIEHLLSRYGAGNFDVVICTEVMEHVRDWRSAIHNLKGMLSEGGILLLTTRSIGFPYHGFPHDFWRYEPADMQAIFGDLSIDALERDPESPGVFILAHRTPGFTERDLDAYSLHSIVTSSRCERVKDSEIIIFKLKYAWWELHKVIRRIAS